MPPIRSEELESLMEAAMAARGPVRTEAARGERAARLLRAATIVARGKHANKSERIALEAS